MKRPATQFYWADHFRDPGIRASSLAARGLWWDMLCMMHEGEPYGHLTVGGAKVSDAQLARMTGEAPVIAADLLKELEDNRVFSRTDTGVIFCRRMVRDEAKREAQAIDGKKGGSPALGIEYNIPGFVYAMRRSADGAVKIGISAQPSKRLYKVRQQFPTQSVELVATLLTEDMGAAEAKLHKRFKAHCMSGNGEWFLLPDDQFQDLLIRLKANTKANLKVKEKGTAPPSSSSSSSTALQLPPERIYAFMGSIRPVWRHAYGGEIPPGSARRLQPVVNELGQEEVARRFTIYCEATDAEFASVAKFVSTIGRWGETSANGNRLIGVGGDPTPEELASIGIKL